MKIVFPNCNPWQAAQAAVSVLLDGVEVPTVTQPGWPLTRFMVLPPRVDSVVLIVLADREAPVLGKNIIPSPQRPLSSWPLGQEVTLSHMASSLSFRSQNTDSRRRGGQPAPEPDPCAAQAQDSLSGALHILEAACYKGNSYLWFTVDGNTTGLPYGHAPPKALVTASRAKQTCVKSFRLTHSCQEGDMTRHSHRAAGVGFSFKKTATFEQAPNGTFLLLRKLRK